MDVDSKYEIFGREVPFKDITNIRRVYQPGILNSSLFFNPDSLREALDGFHYFSQKEILVYFRNISGGIHQNGTNAKRKWWESFQKFNSFIDTSFPASHILEYWYGSDGKEFSSPEFNENEKPYQAFIRLFDDAIQGFSCFVGRNQEGIGFSSDRTNYYTINPGEGLIHDNMTLWTGNSDVFLKSAKVLYDACRGMESCQEHTVGISGHNFNKAEVRIISPGRGAMIGSLFNGSSVTLFLEENSLEKIVENYKKSDFPCLVG